MDTIHLTLESPQASIDILEQGLQHLHNLIANFHRFRLASKIGGPQAQTTFVCAVKNGSNSGFDGSGRLVKSQGVAQKHGSAEDGTNGIGNTLTSDVRCRTVDRLVETRRRLE